MSVMEDKEYYTIKEVAKILRVDPRSIKKMIKEGKIVALKLGERITRIHKLDIPTFIREKNEN